MMKKWPADEASALAEGERGFSFPLPTQVEGTNARGADFSEGTVLTFINHQGSTFNLKSPVAIGTRLKLVIDLPEKLAEDKSPQAGHQGPGGHGRNASGIRPPARK